MYVQTRLDITVLTGDIVTRGWEAKAKQFLDAVPRGRLGLAIMGIGNIGDAKPLTWKPFWKNKELIVN